MTQRGNGGGSGFASENKTYPSLGLALRIRLQPTGVWQIQFSFFQRADASKIHYLVKHSFIVDEILHTKKWH
jgi:hypothetical protein